MTKPPRPHTPEWFKLMRERNPQQTEMIEHIVRLAGSHQCCGVCGDTRQVHDYMTDEELSARLCDDCKGIQEKMYGGKFLPLV